MSRRDTLVAGLLAVGLAVWLFPLARLGADPHHDGVMLKPALDVLSGQVLFRDTFSQYGALTTYLQVLALWIQPDLLSLRLLTVGAYAVALFFLYAAWRLVLPRTLAIVSCGLFILFIPGYEKNWMDQYWMLLPWSSVYALMFQSIALYALLNVLRGEQAERWGFMLGLACAGVFWCRQPVGIIMTGCLVVIWLALHWTGWAPAGLSKRSTLAAILGGFVTVWALLLGGICLSGAASEWWYQNFVWPRNFARLGSHNYWGFASQLFLHPSTGAGLLLLLFAVTAPGLGKRLGARFPPRLVLAYYACLGLALVWQHERVLQMLALRPGGWSTLIPVVVLLQAGGSLWLGFARRTVPKTTEYYLVASLAALSLGSLVQYYPVPDPWHIMWSLGPVFGLMILAFWRWSGWPAYAVAIGFTVAFLPSIHLKLQSVQQALSEPRVTLEHPRTLRGMKVSPAFAQNIDRIMAVLDPILTLQPEIPCALIGSDPLFLCLTPNRTNPVPYYVTWTGLADDEVKQRRWAYIQDVRPLLFLLQADWVAAGDFYRRAHYVPLLYLPEVALELAVPQEIADALGVTTYGAPKKDNAEGSPP